MKFKVKVICCRKSSYWYSRHIGEIFEVEDHDDKDYVLFRPSYGMGGEITAHYIIKSDCLIISKSNNHGDSKLKNYFV